MRSASGRGMTAVGRVIAAAGLGAVLPPCVVGCNRASPFEASRTEELRRSIAASTSREIAPILRSPRGGSGQAGAPESAEASIDPGVRPLTRTPGEVSFAPERMAELEKMAGPTATTKGPLDPGPDLLGRPGETFALSLQQAIGSSVANNLDVQLARIEPGVASSQLAVAESAFDWTFFTDGNYANLDRPQPGQVLGPGNVSSRARVSQSVGYETGLRKRLTTGGQLAVSQGQTYTDDDSPDLELEPEPNNAAQVGISLEQPLLRNFGSDVSTAEIRLARNAERATVLDLKAAMIRTVTDTERAYWRLAQARRNLEVLERLLQRGVETRDVLRGRMKFDAKPSELSEAVATVERRRAAVIRARNDLRLASDRLKQLINDPELTVGGEALLSPIDDAPDAPVSFSLLDTLSEAMSKRPEVQRAVLGIDDAAIRQRVADNARLPALDLAIRAQTQGLDASAGEAYEQVNEGRFVDYLVGLAFEQPIGNRGPEAAYRQRQLERVRAATGYRQAVQGVVVEAKAALRNITTNYQLIEQTRASRLAATENLRTLEVQERTIQSLTPDFLDLKFRRQEALANAELDEIAAVTDYNIAVADLAAAQGTALERNRVNFVVPEGK
ncbi:MAG: TolC family protein [Phycisphaerales bacterium]